MKIPKIYRITFQNQDPEYTNDPAAWLKAHNEARGEDPEAMEDFDVERVDILLFDDEGNELDKNYWEMPVHVAWYDSPTAELAKDLFMRDTDNKWNLNFYKVKAVRVEYGDSNEWRVEVWEK